MTAEAAPAATAEAESPMLRPFRLIGRTVMAAFREVGRIAVFSARVLIACVTPVIYVREFFRQCLKIGY
jgi:hypothetical protein